ncbi:hypothetical protein EYF80_067297 [Liparis tanakae]|uniref:Uncharacterized protein n=1 Tax=Liparis tanakae TaxID=230148 RepID=A0A4Z2E271_9TELE|nr:hypothetical protein EYF80_067297 [Liparis tanakae]
MSPCLRVDVSVSPCLCASPSGSEVVYRNRDGHVIKFNFASNETEVILTNSTFVRCFKNIYIIILLCIILLLCLLLYNVLH